MRKIRYTVLALGVAFAVSACGSCERASCAQQDAPKKERKIAVQMYTFKNYTFEESVPWLAKNGIRGLGITGGQILTSKYPKLRFCPQMNAEQRAWFKNFVKANGCKVVSFGVVIPKTEAEIKELCQFAKEMDVPLILTESPAELLPAWEKYCGETGVKMALHNPASNNRANNYYNPDVVAALVKPYKNIGACPDNGHWSRSGIDPVAGYKKLEGKIFALHFKDQAEFGNIKNQCVPFGTGALDMKGMLAELDRQGFDGYYIIEYEAKWDDNIGDVVECAKYLRCN